MSTRALPLAVGEPAPWFVGRTRLREQFHFHTVGGRTIVLAFLGSASHPAGAALLAELTKYRAWFDDERLSFFGVSWDRRDLGNPALKDALPGVRFFWDFDGSLHARYGVTGAAPFAFVLDPTLRILAASSNASALIAVLEAVPPPPPPAPALAQAPVLVLPRVFEPALCARLIEYYDRLGGEDLGFARDIDGKTRRVIDHSHKRRGDRELLDGALCDACRDRIRDHLLPMVQRAYGLRITRMERYLVSCYERDGHFKAHRDNTTKGTAHRKLAVSLFLNTGEFEGGLLKFPEYGSALYSAPAGGAVVFSCSLLHAAMPVTAGRRMMFLPFLYDDEGARIREQNEQHLDVGTALQS